MRDKGVDSIICLSVNDAFVMDAWGKRQSANGKVMMLADGNGEFTAAIGLEMDGSGFGMGTRSLRYSMIVKDGVVETLNIEGNPGEAVGCGCRQYVVAAVITESGTCPGGQFIGLFIAGMSHMPLDPLPSDGVALVFSVQGLP